MKIIRDFNVENKRILIRSDLNVPLNRKGEITDDFRIQRALPTIRYLVEKKAKVILISHLGRPGGQKKKELGLGAVRQKLAEFLNVPILLSSDCVGKEARKFVEKLRPGEVLLLENLRFHKGEEANAPDFAKKLSEFGDIYVNDAFGVCHREHASIIGIPQFLPSAAGFLVEEEVNTLSKILTRPGRPFVAIVGGIKFAGKIKAIKGFLNIADSVFLGGVLANIFLAIDENKFKERWIIDEIEKIKLSDSKICVPVDFQIGAGDLDQSSFKTRIGGVNLREGEKIYDIGPKTIDLFSKAIKSAKTIVWSGPLGLFENEKFAEGSIMIANAAIQNQTAFKVAGGGDTGAFLANYNFRDKFDFISTGGGAMLAFLGGESLPGIKALQ